MKAVILGGGVSGCVAANELYKKGIETVVMEIPSHNNRLYSYNIKSEQDKAAEYMNSLPNQVYTLGRLGTYKYLNINQCIALVLEFIEKL